MRPHMSRDDENALCRERKRSSSKNERRRKRDARQRDRFRRRSVAAPAEIQDHTTLRFGASFPSTSLFFKDFFFMREKKTKKKEIFFSFFCVFFLDATNTRESLRTHKTKNKKKGGEKKGLFFRWLRIKSRLSVVLFLCFFVLSIFIRDPFDPHHHHHHRNIMSNDEEKEEDEVRRRRRQSGGGKQQQQNFLLYSFFARFDAPVARFWTFLARETVAR